MVASAAKRDLPRSSDVKCRGHRTGKSSARSCRGWTVGLQLTARDMFRLHLLSSRPASWVLHQVDGCDGAGAIVTPDCPDSAEGLRPEQSHQDTTFSTLC
jgi:hypothetical protein